MGRTILLAAPYTGKQLWVSEYSLNDAGVSICVQHNATARPGTQLRWIQTVTENGFRYQVCGLPTYVDPISVGGSVPVKGAGICKADDKLPFYYTSDEYEMQGSTFVDHAMEAPGSPGRVWMQFVLALSEVENLHVKRVGAIYWGFDRVDGEKIHVAPVRPPSEDELLRHDEALRQMYPSFTYQ
jgi:hypothetical protein